MESLKEVAGKELARRTGSAYEAVGAGETANIVKALYLYGAKAVYATGISVKAGAHYPGRSDSLIFNSTKTARLRVGHEV